MILGISHLCLVTKKNSDLSKKILKKYSIKFTKKNLKNNNCKKKFLFTKHKSHNISFYKKKNYYNINLSFFFFLIFHQFFQSEHNQ